VSSNQQDNKKDLNYSLSRFVEIKMNQLPVDLLPELDKAQESKLLDLLSDQTGAGDEELKRRFWRKCMTAICIHRRTLSVRLSELDLKVRGFEPDSLPMCLTKLYSDKDIVSRSSVHDKVKEANGSGKGGFGQWVFGTVASLLSPAPTSQQLMGQDLVVEYLIEKCCQLLVDSIEGESLVCFIALKKPTSSMVKPSSPSSSAISTASISAFSPGILAGGPSTSTIVGSSTAHTTLAGSAATSLHDLIASAAQRLNSVTDFHMQQFLLHLKEDDVSLLLDYMISSGRALVSSSNTNVVKIIGSKMKQTSEKCQLSEVDVSRLQLSFAIENVQRRAASLQSQIDAHTEQAKAHKRNNNEVGALLEIKKRKNKEKEREKWQKVLLQLDTNLMSIEGAEMNRVVMEAFTQATIGLRSTREGISVDSIEDAIDAFNEEMENQKEISGTLTSGQNSSDDINQDELEAELESMMAEMSLSSANNTVNSTVNISAAVASSLPSAPNIAHPPPIAHTPTPTTSDRRLEEDALM